MLEIILIVFGLVVSAYGAFRNGFPPDPACFALAFGFAAALVALLSTVHGL